MTDLAIEEALKTAKFNEVVILSLDDEEGIQKEIVLVPTLDTENGGVLWKQAGATASTNTSYDATGTSTNNALSEVDIDIGIMRHIQTKKWFFPMLNDKHRNELYDISIRKGCEMAIENILSEEKGTLDDDHSSESIRILDIGSGSGLLAMMAAKHSSDVLKSAARNRNNHISKVVVKSVEMASAMARLALKTIKENSLDDTIDLIEGHSSDPEFLPFTPSSKKAHICTSELLESGLLGEGIIPAMRDAWDRHLSEGAVMIPQRARVYAQVIECPWISNYCGPSVSEVNLNDTSKPNVFLRGEGVVPLHAEALFGNENDNSEYQLGFSPSDNDSMERARLLSDPCQVLDFDFTKQDNIPTESGRCIEQHMMATRSGVAHGVLFWWELDLFDNITYTTEMGIGPWQDHWQQCVYVFESIDKCIKLTENQQFTLMTSHNDYNISFKINEQEIQEQIKKKRRVVTTDGNRHVISFERALQLNDPERTQAFCSAIKTAIEIKGYDSHVLDTSDFSFCSLIAATKYNAMNVSSVESSSGNLPVLSATIAQITNNLPKDNCNFQILNAHIENIKVEHLLGDCIDIVLCEPYYEIMEGWDIISALNYNYLMKSMKNRGLVKTDAISVPSFASVVCCAIEFHPCVANAYCGLNHDDASIRSFKHESVSHYGNKFDACNMKFPLWQYKWKRLSHNVTLAKIPYEGTVESMNIIGNEEWTEVEFSNNGLCHAIVYWIEYGLRVRSNNKTGSSTSNDGEYKIISSGNRYHQQAVKMLSSPVKVMSEDIGSGKLLVKPLFGESCEDTNDHSFEIKVSLL